MNFLNPLLDIGAIPAPTNTDIDTAIKTAEPEAAYGWIILATAAPNVIASPIYARFIWARVVAGQLNGEFYWYNGTAWEQIVSDDGSRLLPGTVPLDRLLPPGASSSFILRINTGGTAVEAVSAANIFGAGTFPLSKLEAPADPAKTYLLMSQTGNRVWQETTEAYIHSLITNLPPSKLAVPTGKRLLGLIGSAVDWGMPNDVLEDGTVNLTKIAKDETKKGYYFRYNPVTGVVEAEPLASGQGGGVVVVSDLLTIPTYPNDVTYLHGLGRLPDNVAVYFECETANNGYIVGDRIPLDHVWATAASVEVPNYSAVTSVTGVKVLAYNNDTGEAPAVPTGTHAFDPTKWKLRILAFRGMSNGTVFATSVEVAAGVETAKAVSPATLLSASGIAKASATVEVVAISPWSVSIVEERNVTTITVEAITNDLIVTLDNPRPNLDYLPLVQIGAGSGGSMALTSIHTLTSSSFKIDLAAVGTPTYKVFIVVL